jgi:uncharacterized membrane protein YphA (DoxX/SURF4 family)
MKSFVAFLGRALISLIFILAAIHKFMNWQATEQYLNQAFTGWMTLNLTNPSLQHFFEWGLAHTFSLLLLAVFIELIGGLLLFTGLGVRLGAFLLLIFIVVTTYTFHHFWNIQEPQREMEMMNFMKNLSIMGGLLFMLARGKSDTCSKKDEQKKT